MKPFLKSLLAVGAVVAVALLCAPAAFAQCAQSVPAGHYLDAYITGMPEQYLSGRIFVNGNPAINNGSSEFLCRAAGDPASGGDCPATAGTANDGQVVIWGDWFVSGAAGC